MRSAPCRARGLVLVLAPGPRRLRSGSPPRTVSDATRVVLGGVPFTVTIVGRAPYVVRDPYGVGRWTGWHRVRRDVAVGGLVVTDDLWSAAGSRSPIGAAARRARPDAHARGWFSLVPPLIAIALALIFREVVTALFAGVWLGALAVAGFNPLAGHLAPRSTPSWCRRSPTSTAATRRSWSSRCSWAAWSASSRGTAARWASSRRCARSRATRATRQDRDLARRHGDLLRRLREHADRRQHDASDHRPSEDLPRKAGLPRRLDGRPARGDRADLHLGRIRDQPHRGRPRHRGGAEPGHRR